MEGVRKRYRDHVALDGVDLQVAAGEVVALLGPNGAGKTTLARIVLGLRRPDEGRVRVSGGDPVSPRTRRRLGALLQDSGFPDVVTPRRVLDLVRSHYSGGVSGEIMLDDLGLSEVADRTCGALSGGQRRRLGLACALVGEPGLLVLDEPTASLDADAREVAWRELRRRSAGGASVLLTSHDLIEVERLADRVVIIEHGRVVADATPGELRSGVAHTAVTFEAAAEDRADVVRVFGTTAARRSADRSSRDRWQIDAVDSDEAVRALVVSGVKFDMLAIRQADLSEALAARRRSHHGMVPA